MEDKKSKFATRNDDINPEAMRSKFEINYADLSFDKELGSGQFGIVMKGTYRLQSVAIKKLKKPRNEWKNKEMADFFREIDVTK